MGAKSPPEPYLGHQLPPKYRFFCHLFRLCFFIKFWGPTREAQGQELYRGGKRVQVNIDFFMNIGAGAQVLTTLGTSGFPGPVEKDITGNILSQLTLSQLC